ncbi:bifunctional 23S rRNA (guanine(2069)-N(7))-methyltransferase RlmK/23S rRNA (guanine(2445)-N(2))-methyltransferase RlmL [Nitrincola alkalisediminis]|uniref:bifunctional 23S rRNA (guanine(2069)-N(7))-methyltransferase RlmK/23S rRNA (guanine(2445)-N(2))-methyltransferase RlmL n=1 Tax=Nitrincola alkalisediminis TaxID=1366656 RepID=UPI001FECDD56|nr:bifunctional 23S rRNA (guanine(2069)-N(7))-methyltransferase RlmK/23S rRNA (guanine(2445)-N(2))-methyltransferase RlmL [Nitrincola alkalisediminis]
MPIQNDAMGISYFVTCPKGLEALLLDEINALGAISAKQTVAGVACEGDKTLGYRLCLESRLASRVLLRLAEAPAATPDALYDLVQSIDWLELMRPSGTLSVDFNGRSDAINNTHFGALKVKDAIVDQIRGATGQRPSIEKQQPDIRVNVHLAKGQATVSLDMSGESLHRRGYRQQAGEAPMKENLAAAVLLRAGWNKDVFDAVLDPMCGSGTLLIEAAMIAANIAPGLYRHQFGFTHWLTHDRGLWKELCDEAHAKAEAGKVALTAQFYGFDQDEKVLHKAKENIRRAGLSAFIRVELSELSGLQCPQDIEKGLLVTNPPYGERLGETENLMCLYQLLGQQLRSQFEGWRAAVFTSNPDLCKVMKLKAQRSYQLFNGALESRLFLYEVFAQEDRVQDEAKTLELTESAQMVANRIQKNQKNLGKWIKKEGIECYRVYDADIPEYAVAVDCYGDEVIVQEYQAPSSVDPVKAFSRFNEAVAAVAQVMNKKPQQIVVKRRKRQQGTEQYERHDTTDHFFVVTELGCKLWVNLHDYLDTGLFLDHRPVRRKIQSIAQGKNVLNLFSYTATASLHAAVGGASRTTSVDMSSTYLDWARRNFALNGLDNSNHHFVREDCFKWLERQSSAQYDLIFMDPPTFSNSKRMEGVLDVQRDHVRLIHLAMGLLKKEGLLIFSNNYRRFKLDSDALHAYEVKDVTASTIDPDFKRNAKIHCCFEIKHSQV